MPHCFVPGCKNCDRKRDETITFHRIPKEHQLEWLAAIQQRLDSIITGQRICSAHFRDEDFVPHSSRKMLKSNAVPSLKLPARVKKSLKFEEASTIPTSSGAEAPDFVVLEIVPATDDNGGDLKGVLKRSGASKGSSKKSDNGESRVTFANPNEAVFHTQKRKQSSSSESAASSVKRRRIKMFHTYSKSPGKYTKRVTREKERAAMYKVKFETVKRTSQRRKQQVQHLKQVTKELDKQNMLSNDALTVLEHTFSGVPAALMKRMLTNVRRGKRNRQEYSEELKSFAMTLQFYSSKAYEFVRRTFDLALPAQSTIRNWLSKIDCQPGFSEPSLNLLKAQSKKHMDKKGQTLLCSLLLDEMALKKQIDFEIGSQKCYGYVDMGTDIPDTDDLEAAKEVLVLMVVGVNEHFKIPIGYFFINKLSGEEKANLVQEALRYVHPTGIKILSVTCDGPHVNFTMMKYLQCNVTDPSNLKTYFEHPVDNSNVYVILDICHMLKLIRNNWAKLRTFMDPNGDIIDWRYIELLYQLQKNEGLHLATKLRKKHMEWQKAIMKVNLAAQTLSRSVADALEFLQKDLMLPEFANVGPTVRFIRLINDVFDLMNSRNLYARGMKTPLKPENECYWRPFLENAVIYLANCRDMTNKCLYKTLKKTPFLGFIVSITSLLHIFDEAVKTKQMISYILTYKFSQDHLELFFCSVRSRNGWNDNPTCLQFVKTYKRLLLHGAIRNDDGNCISQDQTNILTIAATGNQVDITDVHFNRNSEEATTLDEKCSIALPVSLSEYADNVIAYIAGYVITMVRRQIRCATCINALILDEHDDREDYSLQLINRRQRGGLILPSQSLRKLCKRVETKIRVICSLMPSKTVLPPKDIFLKTLLKDAQEVLVDAHSFSVLRDHVFDTSVHETPHKLKLINCIITSYAKIRLNSMARHINEDITGSSIRKTLRRTIIFRNQ